MSCFQWFKDTNLKANHNKWNNIYKWNTAVSNGSKILIWKQITTISLNIYNYESCFQWFKDTNLKANHNEAYKRHEADLAVSNGSKILIWKQITTPSFIILPLYGCFQWFKDTNLKANHNLNGRFVLSVNAVSNGSKILIWKQITTYCYQTNLTLGCFQWFKDTNLKVNYNNIAAIIINMNNVKA